MVGLSICGSGMTLTLYPGVDACNTVLEVLLFAAATNLGQGWNTVLTLFGGWIIRNTWLCPIAEAPH